METTVKPGRAKVCVIGATPETINNITKVYEVYKDRYVSDSTPRILIEKMFKLFTPEKMIDIIVAKLSARKGGNVL